ncbi:MAG: AI-2E family transporter [Cytophagales bacterium]|nr:MAG: AI-2E family transporter [Cytophagales bacterium]TAF59543.1 MAG: AI-2E family transporter [Cytophagales bacterium]
MNIYSANQKKSLLIIAVVVLAAFIFFGIKEYLGAILGSLIVYALFKRPFDYLINKKKWSRGLATVAIMSLSAIVLIVPFFLLSFMLTRKVISYGRRVGELMPLLNKVEGYLMQYADMDLADLKAYLPKVLEKSTAFISQLFPSLLSGTLDIVFGLVILYFVLYYMYQHDKQIRDALLRYLPFDRITSLRMFSELQKSIYANVVGQGLISFVQAALVGIGFLVCDFGDAFFWSVISFFMSFIPMLGTPLVWGPAALIAIIKGDVTAGVGMLIYGGVIIMNSDNVLRMLIAKKMGDTHPLITVMGLIIGIPIFGILGLVLGPVLIAYFVLLLRTYDHQFGEKRLITNPSIESPEPLS